jgi:hypothetical protein
MANSLRPTATSSSLSDRQLSRRTASRSANCGMLSNPHICPPAGISPNMVSDSAQRQNGRHGPAPGPPHYISGMSQISPDAHHQAAQRLAEALLDTLTRECGHAHAEEGFEIDDLIGITLTAMVSLIVQFAGNFGVDPDHLVPRSLRR